MKDAINLYCVTIREKINNNNWKVEGSRFWLQPLSINRGPNKIRLDFFLYNPDITASHRIYL